MVRVNIFTNEISPDGEQTDRLAAAFEVHGQDLTLTEGEGRYVQVGIPVYSEFYGQQIDFDTDGEEWARNLPSAYRNGAIAVEVERVPRKAHAVGHTMGAPHLAVERALPAE